MSYATRGFIVLSFFSYVSFPYRLSQELDHYRRCFINRQRHPRWHYRRSIYCTSLVVTRNGSVNGGIIANQEVTVLLGKVFGTIRGRRVMLQSSAKVEGDIFHQGTGIEMGTRYDGTLRWTEDQHAFDKANSE
jgi:hypothetical protein